MKPIKRFIIRKYVYAKSAIEALKIEKNIKADECYIDEKWLERQEMPAQMIGFDK